MVAALRFVAGTLLIAHGLVHLLYLVDDVPEFRLDTSWAVPKAVRRPVGNTLMAATIAAAMLLGLAVWGLPGLSGFWPVLTVAAATTSLAMLTAFWHNRLVLGVTIDIALITVVVVRPEWTAQI